MKNRQRYISIWLFILSITITLVSIVLIQDKITEATNEHSLELVKEMFNSTSYISMLLLIVQSAICGGLWLVVRNNKIEYEISTELTEQLILKNQRLEKDLINSKKTELKPINNETELKDAISFMPTNNYTFNEISALVLETISKQYEITQGIVYKVDNDSKKLHFSAGYAYYKKESDTYEFGEGLAGQVAKAQRIVNIQSIPAGYIKTVSGLGESIPSHLLIIPVINNSNTLAVIELASFKEFNKDSETQFEHLAEIISEKLLEAKQ